MPRQTPHLERHYNGAYDPWATKFENYRRCSVCGFWLDAEKLTEPDEAVFTIVTTGTTYQIPVGTPADQLAQVVDRTTEIRYIQGASCPHCGAANWATGTAPDIRRT